MTAGSVGYFVTTEVRSRREASAALRLDLGTLAEQVRTLGGGVEGLSTRLAELETEFRDQPNPTKIARSALKSVFTVEAVSYQGTSIGSAFVIKSGPARSVMITNFHVVEDTWNTGSQTVKVIKGNVTHFATIEAFDAALDLALLSVPTQLQPLPVRSRLPRVGETVYVIGSPYGLEGTLVEGVVSALRQDHIQFSAPVSPGDSGGPVLDENGRVIAVTVSKVVDSAAEGLSFGIPASDMCSFAATC